MSTVLKSKAVSLRRHGLTYQEIADRLEVSKSTAHTWTQSIELTNIQKKKIEERQYQAKLGHINRLANLRKQRTLEANAELAEKASLMVGNMQLTKNQKRVMCSLLLWCEGAKDEYSGVQFINSDPILVSTFLKLFRESCDVDEAKFRALVHLHDYHDPKVQISYWSEITGIPVSQFYKPYLKEHTGKRKRDGYPGCISLRYYDASLGKLLKMIYTQFSAQL